MLLLRCPGEQHWQEWRTREKAKPWRKYLDSMLGNAQGRGLAETCIKWKDVVSHSLILWQQRYDLPGLPTTNNMPELIGSIRKSQLLL